MSNAIKFTGENGKISLSIREVETDNTGHIVEILVSDTGIGIPEESYSTIFEQYTRLTPACEGKYKGSGLGLYIVKKFVQEMNGEISVQSQVGEGTTFKVVIPLMFAHLESESKNQSGGNQAMEEKLIRVLLVEDHPMAQKIASQILSALDCNIVIAATGHEALALFQSHQYDWVFMDIGLPDISGYEITGKMRAFEKKHKRGSVPIMALTAHVQPKDLEQAHASGMDKAYPKPLTFELAKEILLKTKSLINLRLPKLEILSSREYEILQLLARGKTYESIVEVLHISLKTIYNIKTKAFKKLSLKSSIELSQLFGEYAQ